MNLAPRFAAGKNAELARLRLDESCTERLRGACSRIDDEAAFESTFDLGGALLPQ